MPTFCRHNRFIERCPICSKTLPGHEPAAKASRATAPRRAGGADARSRRRTVRGEEVRVVRETRAADDGYRSTLLPGLRASADALRLADEIAFSSGRLLALALAPTGLYAEAGALAGSDLERATWICFLIAYLCPLQGEDPFAGIRLALEGGPDQLDDLAGVPLGPLTSHDPAYGPRTLLAYRRWVAQAGSQQRAFTGDPQWGPKRRFERLFERLALPGFGRMARFELLVTLGRLGLYELQAGSLYFSSARAGSTTDPVAAAAKRVFGIGDPLHLDRRALALAEAVAVPIETLELALANWGTGERATLGFPPDTWDPQARERACQALALGD